MTHVYHMPRLYGPERLCSDEDLLLANSLLDKLPYYRLVPKDWKSNIEYRKRLFRWAKGSRANQQRLWAACSQDILFYINTVGTTLDPRPPYAAYPVLPFVTFDYQDDLIVLLLHAIENGINVRVEKSRAMSYSWCTALVFEWLWHFRPYQSFTLLSYKQDLVDKTGDMKSLFQKLDFFHENMPDWLVPGRQRNLLHMENLWNKSLIEGEATTQRSSRGGRNTAIMWDEVAFSENAAEIARSMRSATGCRILGSTANGDKYLFYDLRNHPSFRHIRMHWSMHPVYRRGLYRDSNGKLRSPWYDHQCAEALHPHEIPQELDIDYSVYASEFFRSDVLQRIREQSVIPPYVVGVLNGKDGKPESFASDPNGKLKLWFHPTADGTPPRRRYTIGCDVATGTAPGEKAASNSCLKVIDAQLAECVAEFADPNIMPHEFARLAVTVGRWFRDEDGRPAKLIWESQGPGQIFGRVLRDMSYENMYMRQDLDNRRAVPQDKPGFYMSKAAKRELLDELARVWQDGLYTERSMETVREAQQIVFHDNGSVGHSGEHDREDPTGLDVNHGDRVMATAMAWWEARGGVHHLKLVPPAPPPGSLDAIVAEVCRKQFENRQSLWLPKVTRWSA